MLNALKPYKAGKNTRLFLLISSLAQGLGIYLSGYENIHWLLYLISLMFFGAALNGYCTMMILIENVFGKEKK
jgi:hypothetical protein